MAEKRLVSRLFWFAGLWLAGVGTITVIGLVIRFWLSP